MLIFLGGQLFFLKSQNLRFFSIFCMNSGASNLQSLLDNIIFTYGSGLGDGATHQYSALPIILAGSGGGKLITGKQLNLSVTSGPVQKKDGQYQKIEGGTPLANLWLTQAQVMGLKQKRYADSTGVLSGLLA